MSTKETQSDNRLYKPGEFVPGVGKLLYIETVTIPQPPPESIYVFETFEYNIELIANGKVLKHCVTTGMSNDATTSFELAITRAMKVARDWQAVDIAVRVTRNTAIRKFELGPVSEYLSWLDLLRQASYIPDSSLALPPEVVFTTNYAEVSEWDRWLAAQSKGGTDAAP